MPDRLGSCGTGFQVQRNAPVRASNARTSPVAPTLELLSAMAEPTTIRSPMTAGGEVCSYSSPYDCLLRSSGTRSIYAALGRTPDRTCRSPRRARPCARRRRRRRCAATHGRARFRARILPVRHSAAHPVAEVAVALHTDIAHPALLAGDRIEREHLAERRGQIHHAVDDQRRGFERGGIAGLDASLAGLVLPGEREPADVRAIDLRQRRVAVAAGRAAVVRPVAGRGLGGIEPRRDTSRTRAAACFLSCSTSDLFMAQLCTRRVEVCRSG